MIIYLSGAIATSHFNMTRLRGERKAEMCAVFGTHHTHRAHHVSSFHARHGAWDPWHSFLARNTVGYMALQVDIKDIHCVAQREAGSASDVECYPVTLCSGVLPRDMEVNTCYGVLPSKVEVHTVIWGLGSTQRWRGTAVRDGCWYCAKAPRAGRVTQ